MHGAEPAASVKAAPVAPGPPAGPAAPAGKATAEVVRALTQHAAGAAKERDTEQPAPTLAAIPEQRSSESEPEASSSPAKLDVGHLVVTTSAAAVGAGVGKHLAASPQPAVAGEPGDGRVAAVQTPTQLPGAVEQRGQAGQQALAPAAAVEPGLGRSPMLAAETSAADRMRAAEQRHVDKLRKRAASLAVNASHSAPTKLGAGSLGQPQQHSAAASTSYGYGLAKSASHLLSKLLGKRGKGGSLTRSASSWPALGPSAASSSTATSRSSIALKASAASVERSAVSVSVPAASFDSAGGSRPVGNLVGCRDAPPRPHPPPSAACASNSASQTSPRSPSSQLHAGQGAPVQRRSLAATSPISSASITLRSPVDASPTILRTDRLAPAASNAASPRRAAQSDLMAAEPGAACSGSFVRPEAAAPTTASNEGNGGSRENGEAVQRSSNSKSVRFAGPLSLAGPSGELQASMAKGKVAGVRPVHLPRIL